MKISEAIALLTAELQRLGDRELYEGVTFGPHHQCRISEVIDGNYIGYPGAAILFLQREPLLTNIAS